MEQGKEKRLCFHYVWQKKAGSGTEIQQFYAEILWRACCHELANSGTAADIIKIAMNRVYKRLLDEKLRSRLVLQVHDELLIETWKDEIPQVSRILEEEMKGAANLAVELEVDMHRGNNWYEAK